MGLIVESAAWLAALALLTACSAFFSGSEAALFFLSARDRHEFARGTHGQRAAVRLLADPERLLSALLFGNLLVNMSYFAIAALLAADWPGAAGGVLAAGAFLSLILLGEILPKSVAVLSPRRYAPLASLPLSLVVRIVDPLLPALRTVNLLSRRLLLPRLETESYLALSDLERAVEFSTADVAHRGQERRVLANIVSLAELRVDEVMRPRTLIRTFRPPVARADLAGQVPPSGYLLVTEPDSDEIAQSVPLRRLADVPEDRLERYGDDVVYVPWTATVAQALDLIRSEECDVAVVVNEFGETIGVLTYEDILHTVFSSSPSPAMRLHRQEPIRHVGPEVWQALGLASVRRLVRELGLAAAPTQSVTLAGALQETLQRLPVAGDRGIWHGLQFTVLEAPEQGALLVELQRLPAEPEAAP